MRNAAPNYKFRCISTTGMAAAWVHAADCLDCGLYGCAVRPVVDVDESVNMATGNAAAVFEFLGVPLCDEAGEAVGSMAGADLLVACQIALGTGCPVIHARPASEHQDNNGARMIDCGLDEDYLVQRVRQLADLATTATILGRAIVWH